MPKVELDLETSVSPDGVRAALLDFTQRRPEIWPGLSPELYEVYEVGETSADIREGTKFPLGKVWAKERYDWSDANTIRWTVVESKFSTVGSYVAATLSPRDGGGTLVHIEWNREGASFMGKLIVRMIVLSKGKPVASSFQKAMKKLEAQSSA